MAYKIVTNLVMLPLAASLLKVDGNYAKNAELHAVRRGRVLRVLAKVAIPRNAAIVLLAAVVVFAVAAWESRDRVVGTLQAGAPELRADARFNQDSVSIASSYDVGLDWISIVFEAPPQSRNNVEVGAYQDRFVWSMRAVPGVLSVVSFSSLLRQYSEGYNEGNPKMSAIPIDPDNYSSLAGEVARTPGVMRKDCSMTAVNIYLADHKATTITQVINAAKHFRDTNKLPGVKIRLASGNAGVLAAVNDEIERSELPMMLYVYTTIVLLVLVTYRDLRAVLACCLPLTIGTFIGYWFMKELQIGLTVATLPVMVLAVGIGVDYAFYIYNRLQLHLANGVGIVKALEQSILEIGTATIFTAITLAIGVATWSFSGFKFQADMGKLLAFMFIVNMVMAMTVLPAFAVWLERIFPRRKPARAPACSPIEEEEDSMTLYRKVLSLSAGAVVYGALLGSMPGAVAAPELRPVPAVQSSIATQSPCWMRPSRPAGRECRRKRRRPAVRQPRCDVPPGQVRAREPTLTSVSFIDARTGWAVGHWGAILKTTDGGETWEVQRLVTSEDRPLFGVHFIDANHGVAVGLWSLILVTDDGGKTWTKRKPCSRTARSRT